MSGSGRWKKPSHQIAVSNVRVAAQNHSEEVSAMKIRVRFRKWGSMKFIGHLDMMRYFQKAVRRADIDICYSEGFSPHQIMSFAAPLVADSNTSISAARPAMKVLIFAISSSFVSRNFSSSGV